MVENFKLRSRNEWIYDYHKLLGIRAAHWKRGHKKRNNTDKVLQNLYFYYNAEANTSDKGDIVRLLLFCMQIAHS